MAEKKETVCVIGAGGFQASWLVKLLLSQGYIVHGTVRDPSDEKNAHLMKLDNASENLGIFKADVLNYDSLYAAIEGTTGVFHVASPVPPGCVIPGSTALSNPEEEVLEPAVTGTSNVLKACSAAKVKKVVIVSSVAAVTLNPKWPKEQVMDESCWSDKEFCKNSEYWYCLSKTQAEEKVWEHVKMSGLNILTVCPSIIFGPLLQSTINATSLLLIMIMKDGMEKLESLFHMFVDVRDVADALLLVYEKPEAEGRYICSSHTISMDDLVEKLKSIYPNYNYPKKIIPAHDNISSEKLIKLGWKHRELEEILVDSIKCYHEKGMLAEV